MEIDGINTSITIYGETWINIYDEKTDTGYTVLVEWTKLGEKTRIEEANITRVEQISDKESHWYESEEEWENIEGWDEIEEKVWEAFDEEIGNGVI